MTSEAAVLWDVVEEHLDEATFLLNLWLGAARSPRVSLTQLQKNAEPRLIAHLDGLALGGEAVADQRLWPMFEKKAKAKMPRVAAAASALLLDPSTTIRDRLLEILRTTEAPAVRDGLARAFEVTARNDVDEPLRMTLYATEGAATQAVLLSVLAARRVDPGPIVATLLAKEDPDLLRAALTAAAASEDRARHRNLVETHLSHDLPAIRGAALRTGLIWNLRAAWQACFTEARAGRSEAMLFLAMLGDARDLSTLLDALGSDERRKAALFALGFSGRVEALDACLPFLDHADPHVAKLAIEAVAGITGLPLYDQPFVQAAEDDDGELPPLEEDLAIDLTPKPLDELPRPNAAEVRKWSSGRRASFAAGQRYLRGLLVSAASAELALADGPLRRSGALACEIAIRSGGRVKVPALHLAYPRPALSAELALHRQPGWL
jgi:uncharacterized protein (TIGR02270 family)